MPLIYGPGYTINLSPRLLERLERVSNQGWLGLQDYLRRCITDYCDDYELVTCLRCEGAGCTLCDDDGQIERQCTYKSEGSEDEE